MLETSNIDKLFNESGHLTEEGIAIWVDALQYQAEERLPQKIREHVETCLECKSAIIDTFSIFDQEGSALTQHPYFEDEIHKQKRSARNTSNLWLKIAASVILLISIVIVLLLLFKPTNNNKDLFAEYFSPYPNILTERNITKEYDNKLLIVALDHYDKGEFNKANQIFEELVKQEVVSDTVLFYYGNTSLATGDTDQAIKSFEQLLLDTNSRILLQAEWYLALAYLSENKVDQCMLYLKKIIQKETHLNIKAQELFNKIE